MLRPATLVVLLTALARAAQAQPATVAITGVTVIDVRDGRLAQGSTILIRDHRIEAVGPASATPVPAGAQVIDGHGQYAIPGLWDMHVHAAWGGLDRVFLPALLANGVTGVREMFGARAGVDSARAAVRRGTLAGPRIVAAGHILDGVPAIWPGSVGVATAEEARRAVDSLVAGGADFIKVYSRLTPEAFAAAGEQAVRRGVPFAGHVPSLVSVVEAARAGIRSIEHLQQIPQACSSRADQLLADLRAAHAAAGWDSAGRVGRGQTAAVAATFDPARCRDVGAELARLGVWMVPTLAVLYSVAHLTDSTLRLDPRLRYVPAAMRAGWDPSRDFRFRMLTPADWIARRDLYRTQLEVFRALHAAGARFLAGTDLANPFVYPGFSLQDELVRFVELGMTPLEALQSATLGPAEFLGATDSLGTVAPGRLADLVLLEANPLEDIRHVARVAVVIADGRVYDRARRDALLAEVEARAR